MNLKEHYHSLPLAMHVFGILSGAYIIAGLILLPALLLTYLKPRHKHK